MSCALTRGRTELACRDNIGGVRRIFLAKFANYTFKQIGGTRGVEVTSFPTTTFYQYECENASYSESISNNADGVSFNQTLQFTLTKSDLITTNELDRAQKIDLYAVAELNDGTQRILGLFNGARINNYTIESGGAKSDLNGYNVTIQATEEYAAAFFDTSLVGENFLLLEDSFNYLLETGDLIELE